MFWIPEYIIWKIFTMDEGTWLAVVEKLGVMTLDPELQRYAKTVFTNSYTCEDCTVYVCFGRFHRSPDSDGTELPAIIVPNKMEYYQHGNLHRDHGPAYVTSEILMWYQYGKLHRTDGPAVLAKDVMEWHQDDLYHNASGPAKIYNHGNQHWALSGHKHRVPESAGPVVIHTDGSQRWYKHGVIHRTGGPAEILIGTGKFWYHENLLHREFGPAIIYTNGEEVYAHRGEFDDQRCNFRKKPVRCENPGFATYTVASLQIPYELMWQIFTMDASTWTAVVLKLGTLTLNRNLQRYAQDTFTEIYQCGKIKFTILFGRRHGRKVGNDEVSYWRFGKLHRSPDSDGMEQPAIVSKTKLMWACYGKMHRVDGPAVIMKKKDGMV